MFYFIGLGLGGVDDITVKGLDIVKSSKRVYLEAYTSILTVGKEALEDYYGCKIILANRDSVEQNSDELLAGADIDDVAFLVVGDPFGATTHTDLLLRAREIGVPYSVVHNASIMNAIGCCGLQLYNYGQTVSFVFWTDTCKPESYFDRILANKERGLHTLCLLDIKMQEQSIENLMRGRKVYEPPRFMNASEASQQILDIIARRRNTDEDQKVISESSLAVGLARVGCSDQKICVGTLAQLADEDLGPPLHSLVIVGDTHHVEIDVLKLFCEDHSIFNVDT